MLRTAFPLAVAAALGAAGMAAQQPIGPGGVEPARAEPRARPLRVGDRVRGRLDADDYAGPGGAEDHYLVRGRPGETVTFTLASAEFDTHVLFGDWADGALRVLGANDDDGSGEGTDSRLTVTFRDAREHHVVVRSFIGHQSGAYLLSMLPGQADDPPAEREGPDGPPGVVRAGETVAGTLGPDDGRADDGSWYDVYTLRGRPGETVEVTLRSAAFDAFVSAGSLDDGVFQEAESDDDSGGGTDARLRLTVPRTGEVSIRVNSRFPDEVGPYTLAVVARR